MIAETPSPPYYAVIFTSLKTNEDDTNYGLAAERMVELAAQQPGYLGMESVRENLGITVSYWDSLESIRQWKIHTEHTLARKKGREIWYQAFKTRICLVERDYGWEK
ncbi:MAG: antibiotic biosynthesis monooxygenase family protein [Saprospiraceae bacterium]